MVGGDYLNYTFASVEELGYGSTEFSYFAPHDRTYAHTCTNAAGAVGRSAPIRFEVILRI